MSDIGHGIAKAAGQMLIIAVIAVALSVAAAFAVGAYFF
jgi:hypothetical protein